MLAALGIVIPLGLAASVSPVLLTEQTVLLAGPGGRRAGMRFAAGGILTLLVVVFALMVFGRAISLPTEPRLDASLDLALGLLLLLSPSLSGPRGGVAGPRRKTPAAHTGRGRRFPSASSRWPPTSRRSP